MGSRRPIVCSISILRKNDHSYSFPSHLTPEMEILWFPGITRLVISGTFSQSSDRRLKEGIEPLRNVLSKILNIQPVYYRWKHQRAVAHRRKRLESLQDIEKVFPELIGYDSQGFLVVEYSKLGAVLIEGIKEHNYKIQQQHNEIQELKEHNKELYKEIQELKSLFKQQQR